MITRARSKTGSPSSSETRGGAECRLLPRRIDQAGADLSDPLFAKIRQSCSGAHASDLLLSALCLRWVFQSVTIEWCEEGSEGH